MSSIDIARGTAMFFVCLSHFSGAYLWPARTPEAVLLSTISMIASPSFVLISGITFGFLGALNPTGQPHLRIRLLDRGLFLLLIGHCILALSQLRQNDVSAAYRVSFMTDALAVAIIIGPRVVDVTGRPVRVVLALLLYCAEWIALTQWHPGSSSGLIVQRYVLGNPLSDASRSQPSIFPVLPWLAVYLLGTVFGEHLAHFHLKREAHRARRLLLLVGVGCTLLGFLVYAVTRRIEAVHAVVSRSMLAVALTRPTQKFPPGLTYIAYFGGSGLVCMWLVLELEAGQRLQWLTESFRRVGYASLPVFLLQAFVYSMLLPIAKLPYTLLWPLLFFCTLVPIWVLATIWCRVEANRFLTVGITSWLESSSGAGVPNPTRWLGLRIRHSESWRS